MDSFEEAPRARRIRERERLLVRAARIAARWNDLPDNAHREVRRERRPDGGFEIIRDGGLAWPEFEWRDAHGCVRHGHRDWSDVFAARDLFARRNVDHMKRRSSCLCCINPRRLGGGAERLTMQERRAADATRDQDID